jgi:hypothetical protein
MLQMDLIFRLDNELCSATIFILKSSKIKSSIFCALQQTPAAATQTPDHAAAAAACLILVARSALAW